MISSIPESHCRSIIEKPAILNDRIICNNVADSATPQDPMELLISPPSLAVLNVDDNKRSCYDNDASPPRGCFHMSNSIFRRKSATEMELFGTVNSQTKNRAIISETNSFGGEHRKVQRIRSVPINPSDMSPTTIYNKHKRTCHKSEIPTKTSLRELFFKNRKADHLSSDVRFSSKQGVNQHNESSERLTVISSEQLADGKTSSTVETWAHSLEKLLADTEGLKCFQEFLKKEFSEENLLFWIACERFKKVNDTVQMLIMAHEIFNNYLSRDASSLVNVDSVAVKRTESVLNTPHVHMFNVAQQQVFQLMKFDGYNRFLKSTLYQSKLSAAMSSRLDEVNEHDSFENNQISKLARSPMVPAPSEKRRSRLNFLNKGKNTIYHDKVKTKRSSSLGAYDKCNCKSDVYASEINGYATKDQLLNISQSKSKIICVVLPDGASTFIIGLAGKTLRERLKELGEQKNFQLQTVNVTVGCDKKIANLDTDIADLEESLVHLERSVLLTFDLPNGRSVGIKTNRNKTLRDVLQPIMKANEFEMDDYSILLINTNMMVSLDLCVLAMENKRIVTKLNRKKLEKEISDSGMNRNGTQGFHASFQKYCMNNDSDTQFRRCSIDNDNDAKEGDGEVTRKTSCESAAASL